MFSNGLGIIVQPNHITIAEVMGSKNSDEIQVEKIACQLVKKLPQVEYETVGINPRGFVHFDSEQERVQDLQVLVNNWQKNVNTFQKLITEKFLTSATPLTSISLLP